MEDWAEIRRLHRAEGMGVKTIARVLGVARNTVRSALASDTPPRYSRPARASMFEEYEPRVRELLGDVPSMPATVLAQRVGWTGSASHFREKVAAIKAQLAVADPADRLFFDAGELFQCDLWFPPADIPVGHGQSSAKLPVLAMTGGFSRMIWAVMIPSKASHDLLAGMWFLLQLIGGVPRKLIWDNETGIGRGKLTDAAAAFAGTLGTRIVQLPPRDPESKGIVERTNRYFETSFMPGRSFASPEDFNAQLTGWLPYANRRMHRRLGGRPADFHERDLAAMMALPPVAPLVEFRARTRLPRDYYVRVDTNDYSVDPSAIGRIVEVRADLARVRVFSDGRQVADHARIWAKRQTVTEAAHVDSARRLRAMFKEQQRERAGSGHRDRQLAVAQRPLSDYDNLFDVDFSAPAADGQVA